MRNPLLLIHICTATIGLLSGSLAMVLRKGSSLHRLAGNFFFVSMLIMTSTATVLAFMKPSPISSVVGILTFYLVATAWVTVKRRDSQTGAFDLIAIVLAAFAGIRGIAFGVAYDPRNWPEPIPAGMYFFFGSIALLFAVSDVRTYLRGGAAGAKRIARHLWRMCLALLIAILSFYPGQAKLFSAALRKTNLLSIPLVVIAGMTIFWLVRIRFTNVRSSSREGGHRWKPEHSLGSAASST